MSTNPLTDYMLYIVDVACDGPTSHIPSPQPNIPSNTVATFIADTLRALGSHGVSITRTGTERAADILFSHPESIALFRNIEATNNLRAIINGEILPAQETTQVFRDHWTYIISPTMEEHVIIARLTHT